MTGVPSSTAIAARGAGRPVLGFIAELEAASQHTTLHAWIARSSLNVLAGSVEFVRTTPATHLVSSLSINT